MKLKHCSPYFAIFIILWGIVEHYSQHEFRFVMIFCAALFIFFIASDKSNMGDGAYPVRKNLYCVVSPILLAALVLGHEFLQYLILSYLGTVGICHQFQMNKLARSSIFLILFFSFPWIEIGILDISWNFRYSSAYVVEKVFGGLGFAVIRDGTRLSVEHSIIDIAEACAGVNSLNLMLMTGAFVCRKLFSQSYITFLVLILLFVLAWFSNTLRIHIITVFVLTFGVEFSSGPIHDLIGLMCVGLVFYFFSHVIRLTPKLYKWIIAF